SRLALQLDAPVTGGQFALDNREQRRTRILDADRNAARNLLAHTADQERKRDAFTLRLDIPDRVLQRSLRHVIAAHLAKDPRPLAAMLRRLSRQHRPQFLRDHLPGRIGRLARKEWVLTGRALAPANQTFGVDFSQKDSSFTGDAKTG